MRPEMFRIVAPIILVVALASAQPAFAQDVVTGNVVLSDGSPPPKPVAIERICAGFKQPETVTDRKGHFWFEPGRFSSTTLDASVRDPRETVLTNPGTGAVTRKAGPPGSARAAGTLQAMAASDQACELRAVLAGFHPELISFAGVPGTVKDVGTIILRPIVTLKEEMAARNAANERAASAKVPVDDSGRTEAEKTLARARRALAEKLFPEAQRELEHLIEMDPNNATGWYELGRVRDCQKNGTEAKRCYKQAIAADQKYEGAYLLLADLLGKEQQWQELADVAGKLIQLNPTSYPAAYYYSSAANYNLGYLDDAGKSAREGLRIDLDHHIPRLHHMLGTVLADDRHFAEAAAQMKLYLQYAPAMRDRDEAQKMIDDWEKLASDTPAGDKSR
jgi:tetratricopeptide (TPR) repeat protein